MGYCHYWELEQEIGRDSFSRIVADVQRIILSIDDMGGRRFLRADSQHNAVAVEQARVESGFDEEVILLNRTR